MTEKTTVRLPGGLLKQAKRKAAAGGRTLTSLIIGGLRLVVAPNRKVEAPKPVIPRISKCTGGLMPGIDLSDSSAIQEMEDLEYVQRMRHFR